MNRFDRWTEKPHPWLESYVKWAQAHYILDRLLPLFAALAGIGSTFGLILIVRWIF